MGRVKDAEFWESARYNNATFMQYYRRFVELAVSMFKWDGLPDTVDERFLELTLFAYGSALWFRDEEIGDLALKFTSNNSFNVYRIPTGRRAIADNGYNAQRTINDSVIIWNNMLHTPTMPDIETFAYRLYNIDRTIDVNVNAQKTPILIRGSERQILTLKNLYLKYNGNEPVVLADDNLSNQPLSSLKTDAPFVADRLYDLKAQIFNECLTFLGISNVSFQKKERMITDEVSSGQGAVIANRYSRLVARQAAAKQINDMFGTNITVRYRDQDVEYEPTVGYSDQDEPTLEEVPDNE